MDFSNDLKFPFQFCASQKGASYCSKDGPFWRVSVGPSAARLTSENRTTTDSPMLITQHLWSLNSYLTRRSSNIKRQIGFKRFQCHFLSCRRQIEVRPSENKRRDCDLRVPFLEARQAGALRGPSFLHLYCSVVDLEEMIRPWCYWIAIVFQTLR